MSLSQFLAVALITFATVSAQAQKRDSTLARLHDAPLAGSARIALSAAYRPVAGVWEAAASSTFAPFINENWQLGIQPSFDVLKEPLATQYSGTVGLLANYLFRQGNVSRPYVGVFLSESGATGSAVTRSVGVQAGWLRFVTPSIAFRTELSFRRFSGVFLDEDFTQLTLTLDPYLFGRASERLTTLPGRGAVDVTGSLQLQITPNHDGLLQVMVAPFLAQWFQPGLSIIYSGSGSDPRIELFGRGYLPLATHFAPFADLFGTANNNANSHGARVGVRSYLTRGVALDVDWEWRNPNVGSRNVFTPSEQHTLRASLITQFGSR